MSLMHILHLQALIVGPLSPIFLMVPTDPQFLHAIITRFRDTARCCSSRSCGNSVLVVGPVVHSPLSVSPSWSGLFPVSLLSSMCTVQVVSPGLLFWALYVPPSFSELWAPCPSPLFLLSTRTLSHAVWVLCIGLLVLRSLCLYGLAVAFLFPLFGTTLAGDLSGSRSWLVSLLSFPGVGISA